MRTERGVPRTFQPCKGQEFLHQECSRVLQLSSIEEMASEVVTFFQTHNCLLEDFPRVDDSYSRSIICRLTNGYEAMIARWSSDAVTLVHGHPECGVYLLLSGEIEVENFTRDGDELILSTSKIWQPGEHFIIRGVPGRYDNGIHRIKARQESLSFHLYSDDAMKGECYAHCELGSVRCKCTV